MQKIIYNTFWWWISNDEILWVKGSNKYLYWSKLNPYYVQVNKWYTKTKLNDWTEWPIIASLYLDPDKFLELTTDWHVYNKDNNWSNDVVKVDTPALNMGMLQTWSNRIWYILSWDWIYTWDVKDTDTLWVENNTKNNYTIEWWVNIPLYNYLYIWNWNKITRVDFTVPTELIFDDFYIVEKDYIIKWITRIWENFFVYATNWYNTKQYLWNWQDKECSQNITWDNRVVNNVAHYVNIDFIITKDRSLNLVNWYNLKKMFDWKNFDFNTNYINSFKINWDSLLIWADEWVYTYWEILPWTWQILNKPFKTYWTTTNIDTKIWDVIYFQWTVDWESWNFKFVYDDTKLLDSAFIELKPYIWNFWEQKNIMKYTLWFEMWDYILSYFKDEYYVNIYSNWNVDVGDVYSYNNVDYTIIAKNDNIINCKTSEIVSTKQTWAFTKKSWWWDDTINVNEMILWYKLKDKITNTNNKFTNQVSETVNKISMAVELVWKNTKLYNAFIYFQNIDEQANQ